MTDFTTGRYTTIDPGSEYDTENSTLDIDDEYFVHYFENYLKVLTAVISIISALSNAIIVYTIFKYQILHTRSNFYVANWCICSFVVTFSVPHLFNLLGLEEIVPRDILCFYEHNILVFMVGNQVFISIIILDWYIITFFSQRSCALRCRRSYKFIIGTVWGLLSILVVLASSSCYIDAFFNWIAYIFIPSYFGVFILVSAVSVMRLIKLKSSSIVVEKSKLEFRLVYSYFMCWMPNLIFILSRLVFAFQYNHTYVYLTFLLGFGNPIILIILFYMYDTNFKLCIRSLFRCKTSITVNERNATKQDTMSIIL